MVGCFWRLKAKLSKLRLEEAAFELRHTVLDTLECGQKRRENMKNEKSKTSGARREFLKTATLGVGAAAVAGTLLKGDDAKAKTPLKSLEGAGYSETEHVKKYYELARM